MSSGTWATFFDIARARDATKQGDGHLSMHAISILQLFAQIEAQEAMFAATGGFFGFVTQEGVRIGDRR